MSVADIDRVSMYHDNFEFRRRRQATHLPFNGSLSFDERQLMSQGFGKRGTDYDVLLREQLEAMAEGK